MGARTHAKRKVSKGFWATPDAHAIKGTLRRPSTDRSPLIAASARRAPRFARPHYKGLRGQLRSFRGAPEPQGQGSLRPIFRSACRYAVACVAILRRCGAK
jgi:hypothetical protein